MNAKKMWRTRMAETVIVEKPHDGWDAKTRVVYYLMGQNNEPRSLIQMAFAIYGNDTIHITDMLRDACIELVNQDILATKTSLPTVSYRLHPEMVIMISQITNEATQH